ncbi:MAG: RagB/SusD family nutrient uptake outer membrane protein [Proteiniphilum sp.]
MKYNIYKRISFAAIIGLFLVTVFASCENDTIELSPVDRLTDETAYLTAEGCELAVVGVYDAAQSGYYKGNNARRGYPFGAASIFQSDMRGADMMNMASFFLVTYNNTINTTSPNNVSMWENSLAAINRANVVIAGINDAKEKGVLTEEEANQYIGECLFIRGLTYSNMLIHFALPYGVQGNNNYGLPYYDFAINSQETMDEALKIERSTVQETYAKIFTDLNNAEQLLPAVHSVNKITRASKGSAIAIKTRLNLWKKDWPAVITEAKKLVTGDAMPFTSPIGGYELEANPATPFTSFSDNSESIFSIENSTDDNPTVNGSLAQMSSTRAGGRQLVGMSPILYNSTFWLANDLRRTTLTKMSSKGIVFADKYQRPLDQDEYAPIIRYAEVLLNYAEASVRSGNPTLALELLNAVRNRSVSPADYYVAADFANNNELLEAILWERRIEFFAEGRRWEDIHRLINDPVFDSMGIPAKTSPQKTKAEHYGFGLPIPASILLTQPIPYTDRRFLWPISQDDIIRNPTLAGQQNTGW